MASTDTPEPAPQADGATAPSADSTAPAAPADETAPSLVFSDLGLSDPVLKALKDSGYTGYLSSEYEGERTPWRAIEQVRRQHALIRRITGELT